MFAQIDHIVILVTDLTTASAEYAGLGFTVTPGGEHTDGATKNALICFADGSYLELLVFQRTAEGHIWWRHTHAGPGLIDYALLPESTAAAVQAARSRGLAIAGPIAGGRQRPDGVQLAWETGRPENGVLPFLCGDVTPRSLRVPEGAAREHANGITGIAEVTIAVHDLELATHQYTLLLGREPDLSHGEIRFPLGNGQITLRAPSPTELNTGALDERLAQRGEGIFAIRFTGPDDVVRGIDRKGHPIL